MRSIVVFAAWLLVCAFGLVALAAKSGESAPNAIAPSVWPVSAHVPKAPRGERPTLLVFVHPKCACTRATLRELDRLLARAKDKPEVAMIVAPGGEPPISIEGAHVLHDGDGTEAARFGVRTSGQILIYARDGRLAFNGGITPARGHEGDSRGFDLALRALSGTASNGHDHQGDKADVFGCGIAKKEP